MSRCVGIVIPVFNNLAYTRRMLESIRQHVTGVTLVVAVVDNGSTDGTSDYLIGLQKTYPPLIIVTNTDNKGYGPAANQGVTALLTLIPESDIIIANNDMELLPGCIDELVKAVESNPKIGIVGGRLLFPDGTIQHDGAYLTSLGWGGHKHGGAPDTVIPTVDDYPEQEYVTGALFYVTNACIRATQEYYKAKGLTYTLFDEQFAPAYFEESVHGSRFTVIKDTSTGEVDVVSFESLFEREVLRGAHITYRGNAEIIYPSSLETLCVDPYQYKAHPLFISRKDLLVFFHSHPGIIAELRLSARVSTFLTTYLQERGDARKTAEILELSSSSLEDCFWALQKRIRRVLTERIVGDFKPVQRMLRHTTNKRMFLCSSKAGESVVTEDHSFFVKEKQAFVRKTPRELSGKLSAINTIINSETLHTTVRFDSFIADLMIKNLQRDKQFYYINAKYKHTKSVLSKFPRFLHIKDDEKKLAALCRFVGAFVSEGCSSSRGYLLSISSTNELWLRGIKRDLEVCLSGHVFCKFTVRDYEEPPVSIIEGKRVIFTSSLHQYRLDISSVLLHSVFRAMCGEGSATKKIPSFIFTLPAELKKEFLKTLNEGDAYLSKNSTAAHTANFSKSYKDNYFLYQTKSLHLISGLCYLLTTLGDRYSTYVDRRGFYTLSLVTKFPNKRSKFAIFPYAPTDYVYDLEVADHHNFVDAFGLVLLHNTAACYVSRLCGFITVQATKAKAIHHENVTGKSVYKDVAAVKKNLSDINQVKFYKAFDGTFDGPLMEDKDRPDKLLMVCKIYGMWSFTQVMKNLAKGLDAAGVDVAIAPEEYHTTFHIDDWSIKRMIQKPKNYWDRVVLRSCEGDHMYLMPPGKRRVAHTTGESSRVPKAWADQLNHVDQVLTTSSFFKDVLLNNGVHTPISIIPNTVDLAIWNRRNPAPTRINNLRSCNFIAMYHWGERKGPDILLKAFAEEFSADDDVSLTLHALSMQHVLQQQGMSVTDYVTSVCGSKSRPPIILVQEYLAEESMPGFLQNFQVHILSSRGEGFGIPIIECATQGIPSIVTNYSGMTDFVTNETGWLLDYKLVDIPLQILPYYRNYIGGQWAEPSVEHLRVLLREAYTNKELRAQKGAAAHKKVQDYDIHAVGRLAKRLIFD